MGTRIFQALIFCMVVSLAAVAGAEVDRDKLLSDPGVYGSFVAFKIDGEWNRLDQKTRMSHLNAFKKVVDRNRQHAAIDTYLLKGLSDRADFLLRVHSTELKNNQQFLLEVAATPFGHYLSTEAVMNGLTKKANYVPGFPEQMKADLKVASESGPYVAVIPIRKDADWWALPQDQRLTMMQEHTEAALPYHKTVKRKLVSLHGT